MIIISTHTLRGERDPILKRTFDIANISTHTLRGERDRVIPETVGQFTDFNSHAPWGA